MFPSSDGERPRHVSPLPPRQVASPGFTLRPKEGGGQERKRMRQPSRVRTVAGSQLQSTQGDPKDRVKFDYPAYQSAGHGDSRAPREKAFLAKELRVNLRARREARRLQKREPPGLHHSHGRVNHASVACTIKCQLRDKRQDPYLQANAPGEVPGGRPDRTTVTRPCRSGLITMCGVHPRQGLDEPC